MASRLFATLPAHSSPTADEMMKAIDDAHVVTWDHDPRHSYALDPRRFLIDGLQQDQIPPPSPRSIMEMLHDEDWHPMRLESPMPLSRVVVVATHERHHAHLGVWDVVRILLACAQSEALLPTFRTANITFPEQDGRVPCLQIMRMQRNEIKVRVWMLPPSTNWYRRPVSWLFGNAPE